MNKKYIYILKDLDEGKDILPQSKSSNLMRPKTSSPKSSKKLFKDNDDLDMDLNNDFLSKTQIKQEINEESKNDDSFEFDYAPSQPIQQKKNVPQKQNILQTQNNKIPEKKQQEEIPIKKLPEKKEEKIISSQNAQINNKKSQIVKKVQIIEQKDQAPDNYQKISRPKTTENKPQSIIKKTNAVDISDIIGDYLKNDKQNDIQLQNNMSMQSAPTPHVQKILKVQKKDTNFFEDILKEEQETLEEAFGGDVQSQLIFPEQKQKEVEQAKVKDSGQKQNSIKQKIQQDKQQNSKDLQVSETDKNQKKIEQQKDQEQKILKEKKEQQQEEEDQKRQNEAVQFIKERELKKQLKDQEDEKRRQEIIESLKQDKEERNKRWSIYKKYLTSKDKMLIDAKSKEAEIKRKELEALKQRFKEIKKLDEDEIKLKEEAFTREIEEIKLQREDLIKDENAIFDQNLIILKSGYENQLDIKEKIYTQEYEVLKDEIEILVNNLQLQNKSKIKIQNIQDEMSSNVKILKELSQKLINDDNEFEQKNNFDKKVKDDILQKYENRLNMLKDFNQNEKSKLQEMIQQLDKEAQAIKQDEQREIQHVRNEKKRILDIKNQITNANEEQRVRLISEKQFLESSTIKQKLSKISEKDKLIRRKNQLKDNIVQLSEKRDEMQNNKYEIEKQMENQFNIFEKQEEEIAQKEANILKLKQEIIDKEFKLGEQRDKFIQEKTKFDVTQQEMERFQISLVDYGKGLRQESQAISAQKTKQIIDEQNIDGMEKQLNKLQNQQAEDDKKIQILNIVNSREKYIQDQQRINLLKDMKFKTFQIGNQKIKENHQNIVHFENSDQNQNKIYSSKQSTPKKVNQSMDLTKKYSSATKKFDFEEYKASLNKLLS